MQRRKIPSVFIKNKHQVSDAASNGSKPKTTHETTDKLQIMHDASNLPASEQAYQYPMRRIRRCGVQETFSRPWLADAKPKRLLAKVQDNRDATTQTVVTLSTCNHRKK